MGSNSSRSLWLAALGLALAACTVLLDPDQYSVADQPGLMQQCSGSDVDCRPNLPAAGGSAGQSGLAGSGAGPGGLSGSGGTPALGNGGSEVGPDPRLEMPMPMPMRPTPANPDAGPPPAPTVCGDSDC